MGIITKTIRRSYTRDVRKEDKINYESEFNGGVYVGTVSKITDLPVSNNHVGEVIYVNETGLVYVYTGSEWTEMGLLTKCTSDNSYYDDTIIDRHYE